MARVDTEVDNEVDYEDRDGLIRSYFYSGFTYAEIVLMLNTRNNIQLSVSHLKRILRKMGLKRKNLNLDIENVIHCISNELRGSGSSMGYRAMHQKLRSVYNLQVDQETVRLCLKMLSWIHKVSKKDQDEDYIVVFIFQKGQTISGI